MKKITKIKTSLLYFFSLTMILSIDLEPAFASDSNQKEELTLVVSAYLDDLRVNCEFKADEFAKMKRSA